MDNKQKLQEGLTALGLTLTTAQQLLLLEYVALLKKWNGTYNLTGGGMPGIPAAICRPDLQITLLDANTKKTTFLRQAVIELGLNNVTVASGRVEEMHDKKVDVVTSRAFAELKDFISLTAHLLNGQGYWAAMKGVYPYEELEQVPENVEIVKVDKLSVPMLEAERHMVIMKPKAV